MNGMKFFLLDSFTIGEKKIYPIALLKVIIIKDTFISVDYEVSALKIIENNKKYFKNINLNQMEYEFVNKTF